MAESQQTKAVAVADADAAVANMHLPKDFETAMDAAGFGMFNVLLLLVALLGAIGDVFETSTMSYVLSSAECDLQLTLMDKGTLNAISYMGMATSAIAWGYLADTRGRKKLLILGYLAVSCCVLGGALSQNVLQLIVFKFFSGFSLCGPSVLLTTYLTEMHGKEYRARILMLLGMMYSMATLLLPVLALTILPSTWIIHLFDLTLHSWHIFLAATALPSLLTAFLLTLFPESPKFLMSHGRREEALETFRFIYALNKHKPGHTYPITELANELSIQRKTVPGENIAEKAANLKALDCEKATDAKSTLKSGLHQLRPLLRKPLVELAALVFLANFCILLSQNSIRLWLPQLFASIKEVEQLSDGISTTSMCQILEFSVNSTARKAENYGQSSCGVLITAASYTNNLVVAMVGLGGYFFMSILVNNIGVKRILVFASFATGASGIALYWSVSSLTTVIISSIYVTMGSISGMSLISVTVSLFPTTLRSMVVSLTMMFGRIGSIFGNVVFPSLMASACIYPFFMVSSLMILATILSVFLPAKNKSDLK